ncbi:MAG: hypothetical protein QM817_11900 [Archangium sp.]
MRISAVLAAALLTACAPKMMPPSDTDASVPDDAGVVIDAGPTCGCETWGNGRNDGLFTSPLNELSGLVASRRHSGIFYAHNDSGDTARFFAVSQMAELRETFELDGGTANDWEDIGYGPCPSGQCVFIGDTGDNAHVRTDYAIYRVPEPATITGGTIAVPWERFRFEYPGGVQKNCEAMFVHPVTGQVYVITKEDFGVSEVYKLPLPMDSASQATLQLVTRLTIPSVTDRPLTAADVNPCGTAVLMRMYNRLVEFRLPEGETDFEKIFTVAPVNVSVANEAQGEAVAYGPDGRTYFTSSEKLVDDPPLFEYRCR